MSRKVNVWGQGNKASVSGEERANILLLACCYQEVSTGWHPVTIRGESFTGARTVAFGGVRTSSFTVDSDTQISVMVPEGAVSGRVIAAGR